MIPTVSFIGAAGRAFRRIAKLSVEQRMLFGSRSNALKEVGLSSGRSASRQAVVQAAILIKPNCCEAATPSSSPTSSRILPSFTFSNSPIVMVCHWRHSR